MPAPYANRVTTAPLAGRLADRWGTPVVTATGMAVATAGLAGIGVFAVLLVIAGIGPGLFTPADNAAVMAAARPGIPVRRPAF